MLWRTLQVSGFTVHLTYTTIPLPRRGGYLIMEYAMNKGATKEEDLLSISRVRGLLCPICVSDIVTAAGKIPRGICQIQNTQQITQEDWIRWIQFWKQHNVGNFELSTPLGEWINRLGRSMWMNRNSIKIIEIRAKLSGGQQIESEEVKCLREISERLTSWYTVHLQTIEAFIYMY